MKRGTLQVIYATLRLGIERIVRTWVIPMAMFNVYNARDILFIDRI